MTVHTYLGCIHTSMALDVLKIIQSEIKFGSREESCSLPLMGSVFSYGIITIILKMSIVEVCILYIYNIYIYN